ncbi:MAG: hypothetical protein ACRDLL_11750 [Solirubrobacterales bacterium]
MIDRLRFLLDRPLDPAVARAVVLFATAILLGFGAVVVLGSGESGRSATGTEVGSAQSESVGSSEDKVGLEAPPPPRSPRRRRQDPQDEKGSAPARRAERALRSHRALQHVPYRRGALSVRLVGARGGRAMLAVSAPTISAARQGWRHFLRRFGDSGRSYVARFSGTGTGGTDG